MNYDLTRQNFAQAITLSILLIVIYIGKIHFFGAEATATSLHLSIDATHLMEWGKVMLYFIASHTTLTTIALPLLVLYNALHLSRVTIRNVVYTNSSHAVMSLYILCSMLLSEPTTALFAQIIAILVISFFLNILNLKKRRNCAKQFFMASFYVGILSLIYFPFIILWLSIPILTMIFHRYSTKELISYIAGVLFPIFAISYYNWAFYNNFWVLKESVTNSLEAAYSLPLIDFEKINIPEAATMAILLILLIASVVKFFLDSSSIRKRSKSSYQFLFFILIFALSIYTLFAKDLILVSSVIYLIFSIFLLYFLQSFKRSWLRNLIYIIFLITTIISNTL